MELEEAFDRIREIATGDKEREAYEVLVHDMGAYRALYEGAEKKLMRYRDIAAKPDLCINEYNKDRFKDIQTARTQYNLSGSSVSFEDWLFESVPNVKGAIS